MLAREKADEGIGGQLASDSTMGRADSREEMDPSWEESASQERPLVSAATAQMSAISTRDEEFARTTAAVGVGDTSRKSCRERTVLKSDGAPSKLNVSRPAPQVARSRSPTVVPREVRSSNASQRGRKRRP